MPHNKQLQRTVIRRGRAACAPFHYARASRVTRGRAAAELRRSADTRRSVWLVVTLLFGFGSVAAHGGPLIEPTGTWGVGRASVDIVDRGRTMPGSSEPRRLMLRIWYPTDSPSSPAARLPYMEGLDRAGQSVTEEELGLLQLTETHSVAAAPAVPTSRRFPVLLFSHGEQTNAFLYSSLHEDLASRGYVVVGVDHPGAALFVAYPDGSVAPYSEDANLSERVAERAADLRLVRDRLRTLVIRGRRLEDVASERVGVFGHSAGGIASALLCQQPPVADACLNLDGRLNAAPFKVGARISPPSRPFMYITKPFRTLSDAELSAEGITREQATSTQANTWARDGRLLASAGPPSYRVTLHDAEHSSFSDEPLLLDAEDTKSLKLMTMIRGLVAQFFEATLTGSQGGTVASTNNDDLEIEVLAQE
jgi:dienelactone hydrolase